MRTGGGGRSREGDGAPLPVLCTEIWSLTMRRRAGDVGGENCCCCGPAAAEPSEARSRRLLSDIEASVGELTCRPFEYPRDGKFEGTVGVETETDEDEP